jgi:thiaminase
MAKHCRAVCPIGKRCAQPVNEGSLSDWTVHFLKEFQDVKARTDRLLDILYDGQIQPEEIPEMSGIFKELSDLEQVLTEIRFLTMNLMQKKEKTAFCGGGQQFQMSL